jgi:hypothetical protein
MKAAGNDGERGFARLNGLVVEWGGFRGKLTDFWEVFVGFEWYGRQTCFFLRFWGGIQRRTDRSLEKEERKRSREEN